jgi:ABC-type oligopeptide transport system substrate-binding subunit
MKSKNWLILASLTFMGLMGLQTMASVDQVSAVDQPPGYFSITIIAPTNNPARVQHAQVVYRELWKIGIDADLVMVGWDPLIQRMRYSVNFEGYDGDGFDILFVGWTAGDPTDPSLENFYHSRHIDKVAGDDNTAPINDSEVDELCNLIDSELDFDQRREWVRKAIDRVLWEVHPATGLYQAANPFAVHSDLRNFDPFRWGQPNVHPESLYFESGGQTVFKFASNARFIDLNPFISSSYYDSIISQAVRSSTYQYDVSMVYRPVLATGDPIPVGSNDTLASYIDVSTISADSPYAGADASTTWGPSPNVDTAQFNPYKTAEDYSMFLVNLREDIPWHPGWGYDLYDRNVTVDDFQWTLEYLYEEDLGARAAAGTEAYYGTNPYAAIQKINDTLMKINIRGPNNDGVHAQWFTACSLYPMPRHVLDPTFDATPYGGGVGQTPDGTTIAEYGDSAEYEYNTGEKRLLSCGPYYFDSWDEVGQIATMYKFDQWGGRRGSETSLWDTPAYSQNNIETYAVTVYPSKESAEIDLENEEIQGIDAQFQMGPDIPYLQTKSNIQILLVEGGGIQAMYYNTMLPRLSNRYVRLAISHMIPRQRIVDFILGGLGSVNEFIGIPLSSSFYPSEEEWETIGLDTAENAVIDGKEIKFQGHIRYDLDKAWALMEKAGYDMDPFREAVDKINRNGGDEDSPLPVFPVVLAVLGLGAIRLARRGRK